MGIKWNENGYEKFAAGEDQTRGMVVYVYMI